MKTSQQYVEQIEANGLAPDRFYLERENDMVIREVITEIMCNGHLDFNEIGAGFHKTADEIREIVEFSPDKLQMFMDDGLVSIDGEVVRVHKEGFFVVRNIAMAFDPMLKTSDAMYSKTI